MAMTFSLPATNYVTTISMGTSSAWTWGEWVETVPLTGDIAITPFISPITAPIPAPIPAPVPVLDPPEGRSIRLRPRPATPIS